MIFFQVIFWLAVAWIAWVFLGYPLLMMILARISAKPIRKSESYEPEVTFVMAAYNEEKIIGRRLQNYLDLSYPREKLRFLIGSDASTDRTDAIIKEYQDLDQTIELRRFDRSGKTKIVYTLAEDVESELIVFCDADVLLEAEGLRRMVSCFADPDVGGVVVRMEYEEEAKNAGSVGEKTYHGMEDSMRRNESLFYSTISPTGPCFGVRRGAYTPLTDFQMIDDLNLTITIPLNGKRVWFAPEVVARETNRRTLWSEYRRRLRMGQQSMATFLRYDGTRWPWRSQVGFQIWSHKVLRNLATIPILMFMISSIALVNSDTLYFVGACASLLWIGIVLVGLIADRINLNLPLLGYPLYITLMLIGLTVGSLRAVLGGGLVMWDSQRI